MFRFHETNSQSTEKNGGLEDEFLFGGSAYFSGQTVSFMEEWMIFTLLKTNSHPTKN